MMRRGLRLVFFAGLLLFCTRTFAGSLRTDAPNLGVSQGVGSVRENLQDLETEILTHQHTGLDGSSNLYISPVDIKRLGAPGDGSDITGILQAAVNTYPHVRISYGDYLVSDKITIPTNGHLTIEAGARVLAAVRNWNDEGIFYVNGASNVVIDGFGIIDGQKSLNPTGRAYGVQIYGNAENVTVEDITCQDIPAINSNGTNGGDCVIVGNPGFLPKNIKILRTRMLRPVRQGVSMILADGFTLEGNWIEGVSGNDPGACVDLEPGAAGRILRNGLIQDNHFLDCNGYGLIGDQNVGEGININHNEFRGQGLHNAGLATLQWPGARFTNNWMLVTAGQGVAVQTTSGAVVQDNTILAVATSPDVRNGVYLLDANYVDVSHNYIKDFFASAVDVQQAGGGAAFSSTGTKIVGNFCMNNVSTNASAGTAVIFAQESGTHTVTSLSIQGNTIIDTRAGSDRADYGISVNGIDWSRIRNFTVSANNISGMEVSNVRGIFGDQIQSLTIFNPTDVIGFVIEGSTRTGSSAASWGSNCPAVDCTQPAYYLVVRRLDSTGGTHTGYMGVFE